MQQGLLIKSGRRKGVWGKHFEDTVEKSMYKNICSGKLEKIGKMDAAGFVDKKWEEKGCLGQAL